MPASDQGSTSNASAHAGADGPAGDTTELAEELAEELHASNRAWVTWVWQLLGVGGEPASQQVLEQEAAAALAAGDWHRGALLYRALLRPDPVAEHRAEGHRPKTPDSW
ncbi:MAG: hypothetical protein K0U63_09200 [Cyanobacteria bacterium]|nr:hypothetical protein [Cyanobacteriota bacterium]